MNQLLRNHDYAFLKLLTFRILIVLAYQIMAVVVGWHIYEITHDTLALGLIGLAEVVPYFATALFAGHAVDHLCSRRFFGILAATLLGINALTLTALSLGWIGGNASLWPFSDVETCPLCRRSRRFSGHRDKPVVRRSIGASTTVGAVGP